MSSKKLPKLKIPIKQNKFPATNRNEIEIQQDIIRITSGKQSTEYAEALETLIGFDPTLKDRKDKEGTGKIDHITQFDTTGMTGLLVGNIDTTPEEDSETYNLTHLKRIIPNPIAKAEQKREAFSKLTYIQIHINPNRLECACNNNNCKHRQCGQCNHKIEDQKEDREHIEHHCEFNKFEAILDSGSTPNIIKTASLLHTFPSAKLDTVKNMCITANGGTMVIKHSIILDITMKNENEIIKFQAPFFVSDFLQVPVLLGNGLQAGKKAITDTKNGFFKVDYRNFFPYSEMPEYKNESIKVPINICNRLEIIKNIGILTEEDYTIEAMQSKKIEISAYTAHSRLYEIDIYISNQSSKIRGIYICGNYKLHKQGKRHYGQITVTNKTIQTKVIPKETQITWARPITEDMSDNGTLREETFLIDNELNASDTDEDTHDHEQQDMENEDIEPEKEKHPGALRHRLDHIDLEDPRIDETLNEQMLIGEFEDIETSKEAGKEGMIEYWTTETIEMDHLKEGSKPGQLQYYRALLALFPNVFSKHSFDLGKFNLYDIKLETDNTKSGRQRQRPIRQQYWPIIHKKMEEYIKNKIVDISNEPTTFIHNIRAVTLPQSGTSYRDESYASLQQKLRDAQLKPQEQITDLRVTIDFSGSNSLNGSLRVPSNTFPNISKERENTLHCLLSKFDLTKSFSQFPLDEDSVRKTAFYMPNQNGKYGRFLRLPLGVSASPMLLQMALLDTFTDKNLEEFKREYPRLTEFVPESYLDFLIIYIDDLILYTYPLENHIAHRNCLGAMLFALDKVNLKINPKKSAIAHHKIQIFGSSINSKEGVIQIDEDRQKAVKNFRPPSSVAEAISRRCFFTYYGEHLPNFTELWLPIQCMIDTKVFKWTTETQLAWENVMELFKLNLKLHQVTKEDHLLLATDASHSGYSAALFIIIYLNDGTVELKLISCLSRMFSKSDFQKSTYIKELFSLYYAIKYYQDYILNTIHPLTALADARCLLALNQNKQHEARLQGMNEYLRCLPSGMRLLHITTQYNLCADILTRSFEQAPLQEQLTISKKWSQILPPLPKGSEEPVMLTQQQVYAILTSKPEKEFVDCYPIRRPQM